MRSLPKTVYCAVTFFFLLFSREGIYVSQAQVERSHIQDNLSSSSESSRSSSDSEVLHTRLNAVIHYNDYGHDIVINGEVDTYTLNVLEDLQKTYEQVMAMSCKMLSSASIQGIKGQSKSFWCYRAPYLFRSGIIGGLSQDPSKVRSTYLCDGHGLYWFDKQFPSIYLYKPLSNQERQRVQLPKLMDTDADPIAYLLGGRNVLSVVLQVCKWCGEPPHTWYISSLQTIPGKDFNMLTIEAKVRNTLETEPKAFSWAHLQIQQLGPHKYQLVGFNYHIWYVNLDYHTSIRSTLYWQPTALPLSLFHFTPPKGAHVVMFPANASVDDMDKYHTNLSNSKLPQWHATKVGQVPPPLDVVSYPLGKPLTWKSFRGKVVLLDFWAPWCAPCVAMLPQLRQLYGKYHQAGLEIVGICEAPGGDVGVSSLADYLRNKGIDWWVSVDRGGKGSVSEAYKVEAIPFTVLVGRDGRVVSVGGEGAKLERAIVRALGKR